MTDRDNRNGSLPPAYREIIDRVLGEGSPEQAPRFEESNKITQKS